MFTTHSAVVSTTPTSAPSAAVKRAALGGQGRLSLHSLQHGFASLLIAESLDVVFVSRQLGHANPNVTLGVYATSSPGASTAKLRERRWRRATRRWGRRG